MYMCVINDVTERQKGEKEGERETLKTKWDLVISPPAPLHLVDTYMGGERRGGRRRVFHFLRVCVLSCHFPASFTFFLKENIMTS